MQKIHAWLFNLCILCLMTAGTAAAAPVQEVPEASAALGRETASETTQAGTAESSETGAQEKAAANKQKKEAEQEKAAKTAETQQTTDTWQVDYFKGRAFKKRHINLSALHYFHKYKDFGAVSLHYGASLVHATGYLDDEHTGERRDSDAWGMGPGYLVRYEKHLGRKLAAGLDASGSLLAYNKAHPYGGRAYGFLWRIGPRFSYHFTESDALSASYLFQHSSNGMGSHNPGYNGIGVSIGYEHTF